jgi:tetratricopeptide (TPR) repeat protein
VVDHLTDLRDHGVLDGLTTDGDTSALRVAYDLSYEALDAATRRTFRLLGLVPGPDTTVPAVAALIDAPASTAARHLERLALAHLVQEHAPGRYRLHDLLRRYATERAHIDCLEDERDTATHALLDHYLARTDAAADILYPFVLRLSGTQPHRSAFDSEEDALTWLTDEVPNLVAAIRHAHAGRHHRLTWQLVDALRGHCMTNWLAEAPELAQIGLESAEALALPDVRAAAHNNLAATHALRYEFPSAIAHFQAALALYRTVQVRRGVTGVLGNLATVHLDTGDLDRADALFAEAAALDPLGSGLRRQSLGVLHEYRGRLAEAATAHAERAAESHSPHDLVLLARVHARGGDYDAALPVAEEAAKHARRSGDRCTESYALAVLSTIHAGTGDPARAVRLAGTALEFARGTGVPGAEIAGHAALAVSLLAGGHHQRALVSGHHALHLTRRTGTRFDECEALIRIGRIHRAAGSPAQGDHYLGSALHLAKTHGYHGLAEAAAEPFAGSMSRPQRS